MIQVPKETKLYELYKRGSVGRPRLFDEPADMLEACIEYFRWCDANPWIKIDYKGALLQETATPTQKPYTYSGLAVYLGVSMSWFRTFRFRLKDPNYVDENREGFVAVLDFVDATIYTMVYDGALVGAYNSNLASKYLGLTEKIQVDAGTIAINIDKDDELLGAEQEQLTEYTDVTNEEDDEEEE